MIFRNWLRIGIHEATWDFEGKKVMNIARYVLLMGLLSITTVWGADATNAIPQPVTGEAFDTLLSNSPFTRSLGFSDSIILTGIARVENDVFATLYDTKTMESHLVSKTANPLGWQLVGIRGSEANLQTLSAKIQIAGGQVVSIRYQKPPPKSSRAASGSSANGASGNAPPLKPSEVQEAQNAAVNYREGFTSDGYPRQPPPEMVEKLSKLSVGQREDINRQMIGLRNKGLGMEDRRKIYENLVDRSAQGRR